MDNRAISAAIKLQRIKEAYLKQLPDQLDSILKEYERFVEQRGKGGELVGLHRQVHTLRGSSASFGLKRLSAAVSELEKLLKDFLGQSDHPEQKWHVQWQEAYDLVRHEAGNQDAAGIDHRGAELVSVPVPKGDGGAQKLIYICEDDNFQRLTLATQLECFGFNVTSFSNLEQLKQAVKNSPPDVIVMDLIFPDNPLGGADAISQINQNSDQQIPVVFVSSSNTFISRLAATRAGSSAYFTKPINITELSATLCKLASDKAPEPYRILIIDDDPFISGRHAAILEAAGMEVYEVNNPLKIMEPLSEFKPDLILTDMHMPGCNGIELAMTIRQISSVYSIPIVFLSSETDTGKQFHAMCMGGDAFLTKPVIPERLISAVTGRAGRMKYLRSFMVRDSLTSLYNHTTLKEQLEDLVTFSIRGKGELCFAMIDLDHFKQVNDAYGHVMGDNVLISLARMLKQRLRTSDIIGRYGGEEFAVVLPDCSLDEAVGLLDQLRMSFGKLRFPARPEPFSCTFSCGVAALSRFGNTDLLCRAADSALYRAKHSGRNQVMPAATSDLKES